MRSTKGLTPIHLNADLDSCIFQQIKAIAETGVNLIVTGGKVGELALHYANKHKLMIIRLMSKFDLRRLCKAIGATALPRIVSYILLHFSGISF
jgi:chaperonin GroEL (HSP60 family)